LRGIWNCWGSRFGVAGSGFDVLGSGFGIVVWKWNFGLIEGWKNGFSFFAG
jgi:hypothetical protein